MDNLKKIVVFIPAFNEMEIIGSTIDQVREIYTDELTQSKGYFVKMLVINDGSKDQTEMVANDKGVEVVSHAKNLGLGAATRTGMEKAYEMGADIAVKLDADLQHDPLDIENVILPILQNKADICWGSRFAGKINYKMPMIRYVGNKFFTWLMNKLTNYNISDAQTGLMAYSKKYLKIFELWGNYNPPQQLLIDASIKNMRYFEVPVTFNPRITGKSFVSLKYPFHVFVNVFRIMVHSNPIKVFSVFGGVFILLAVIHFIFTIMVKVLDLPIRQYIVENLSLGLLLVGFQAFFFGILADLIIKKK